MNHRKSKFAQLTGSVYAVFIFLFLYAPIAVLIALSFNASKLRSSWGGFSLRWYISLFQNQRIMQALATTLLIALISAAVATVIGTIAALVLHSQRGALKTALLNLTYIPMLNPDIVTGVAMLLLFTFVGYHMGFSSMLLSHIAFNIPYVVMSVLPKLEQMNPSLVDAALDLGMRPLSAIVKVVVPEVMPGIITGFLLAITMSIDDFVISFFTTGPGVSTLSIEIYSMTRRGVNPEINALSTIMFVVVLALLIAVNLRSDKKDGEMINIG
ncbi:MAG: ABC transporter permease [Clostridia bacterium]|jgi:spermidine/putrescine transport system permease protein|nr:ABC transporter permease [Clostridia bacterium]